MNALEKALLKDLLHLVVDKELKVLIDAIIAKLPDAAKGIAIGLEPAILPPLLLALDAEIEKL